MEVVTLFYSDADSLRRQVETSENEVKKTAESVTKTTQALTKACAGNFKVQEVIVSAQVMDGINAVMAIPTEVSQ